MLFFPAFLASLVIVGIPASLAKAAACFGIIRPSAAKRGKLLWMSIASAALSGFFAILIYFGQPIPRAILLFDLVTIPEMAATVTLVVMALALDMRSFRQCRTKADVIGVDWRRNTWLLGSNLWIPWALVILFNFSSGDFHMACRGLSKMSAGDAARYACEDAPRRYWSAHSEDYAEALSAGLDD